MRDDANDVLRVMCCAALALSVAVPALGAQAVEPPLRLREDVHVRPVHGNAMRGLFSGWSNDSLSLVLAAGEAIQLARADIAAIERRTPPSRRQLKHAAVLVGAPMGVLTGLGCLATAGIPALCVGAGIAQAAFFGGVAAGVTYLVGNGEWHAVPPSAWGPTAP